MIDIETDLYDEIARAVYDEVPDAYISSEHVIVPPMFPAVFIEQSFSSELDSTRDSSQEEIANSITWTINVYSNSQSIAKQECKKILNIIDNRLRQCNMIRLEARAIDNAADPSIYRYVGRYMGVVDRKGNMYRR